MTTPATAPTPPKHARRDRARRGFGLRVARVSSPARGRRRPPKQRGIAILAVITAIAIALTIVNEFASRTTIDMLQARNTMDQTRAHFLARSAVNLGELLLRMQGLLDDDYKRGGFITRANGGALVQVTGMSDQLMAAFGGDEEQVKQAVGVTSLDNVQGFGADIGQFGLRMTAVDGRINVNCANGGAPERLLLAKMLKSLFYPFATNSLFDEEDAEGWRRDAETQAEAIIDYIDKSTQRADVADRPAPTGSNGQPPAPAILPEAGGEDYGYESLRDRYLPKNNQLDSVSELRLVRGFDDRLWTLFGGAFRVHGDCKISLRAMEDITVIASVISLAVKDPNDPALRDQTKIWKLAELVLTARTLGETFETLDDFAKFVEDPVAYFTQGLEAAQQAGAEAPAMPQLNLPPGFKGVVLDPVQLGKVVSSDPPRAYQIEAYADIARNPPLLPLRRTIRALWDKRATIANQRWQGKPTTGAWQWMREE